VEDPEQIQYFRDEVLQNYLQENLRAWVLHSDGTYKAAKPNPGGHKPDIQEILMAKP
jgi:hypothetical protein